MTREYIDALENGESNEFPYRFLLRWAWPEHIERAIRLALWAWLKEISEEGSDKPGDCDHLGARACWLIAVHPDAPPAVLDHLANLGAIAFQERVAENPNSWPSTLARLATRDSSEVRAAVADNHNASAETIDMLSKDESADVRLAVAESPLRSTDILIGLTEDENCYVAARAKKTLSQVYPAQLINLRRSRIFNSKLKRVSGN